MELLLARPAVVALAVLGALLATAAALLQARGVIGEKRARALNYAGYAFMGASMLLFVLAGLRGTAP
jgi:uncharacterized protein with PQ loop repeat